MLTANRTDNTYQRLLIISRLYDSSPIQRALTFRHFY